MNQNIRVRFPPSPTGLCHVGTARMAIVNYLFARKHGGSIVFRSEDTDRERSTKDFEEDIVGQLKWLGLSWEEFYRQSERTEIYTEALKKLIATDKAYISEEESKKEAGKMVSVVRLRNPGTVITFADILRGEITFDTTELKDFTIARSINDPLYHFAVVVDDADMGITHVIRGEDHISNTPRQILIQQALGYERPLYAHYPLHLAADRSKLSKRKGDVAVRSYREKGYLPEALLNYLAHLGWTPPSGKEIMALPEMIQEFELEDLHKSGAVFDIEKLRWYNREYLQKFSTEQFAAFALPVFEHVMKSRVTWSKSRADALMPLVRERIHALDDIREFAETGEFDYFFNDPELDASKIPGKGSDVPTTLRHLKHLYALCERMDENADNSDAFKEVFWSYAESEGKGAVLWPLRYALSGKERSPDPFQIAALIGKKGVLERVKRAIAALEA